MKRTLYLILAVFVVSLVFPTTINAKDNDVDSVDEFHQKWNDAMDDYEEEHGDGNQDDEEDDDRISPKDVKQGGVTLESQKYPLSNYFPIIHDESSWWPFSSEKVNKAINSISTGIFSLNKQLSRVVDSALNEFLTLNVIDKVQDTVTEASTDLWDTMEDHFVSILIIIAIAQIFIYYLGERNGNKAGKTALKLMAIIAIALIWVGNSGHYLNLLNHWSDQAQGYLMSAGTTLTQDVDDIKEGSEVKGSAALLRNNFFQMTVRRPYLVMNYGTTDEEAIQEGAVDSEDDRIDHMLGYKTNEDGSEKREELAEKEVDDKGNSHMDQGSVWSKFGISILSIAFTLFLGIPLFILVFFNVLIQFMVLLVAFILPITFAVSILPSFANSGWHSLGRLISTFMMKMFVSILILFTFLIFNIVDELMPPTNVGSYYLNMTLSAFLMLFMIMKRDKIVEFITAGRVVGMTGQLTGGMYNGARRATNMGRSGLQTAGSHAATKGLAAGAGGMAAASALRRGFHKGKDNIQNRAQNRKSQKNEGGQQEQKSESSGNVTNLEQFRERRNARGPQGERSGTQGQESSGSQSSGSQSPASQMTGNGSSKGSDENSSNESYSDGGSQSQGGTDDSNRLSVAPLPVGASSRNRSDLRKHPNNRSSNQNRNDDDRSRDNPQTSGKTTPPKQLTQWESGKQVENQKNGHVTAPVVGNSRGEQRQSSSESNGSNNTSGWGKASRNNRTPQDGRSHNNREMNRPSNSGSPSTKDERKQQRQENRRNKQESRNTKIDKIKDKAKSKRKEMTQNRKRNRRKRR